MLKLIFSFALILTFSQLIVADTITIIQPISDLQAAFCNISAQANSAIKEIHHHRRHKALTFILGFQKHIFGPELSKWMYAQASANATLIGAVLLTPDATNFLNVLKYLNFGNPSPFRHATSWVDACVVANQLVSSVQSFVSADAALIAQVWLLNLWVLMETNFNSMISKYFSKHRKTYTFLSKDAGFKKFAKLVLSI